MPDLFRNWYCSISFAQLSLRPVQRNIKCKNCPTEKISTWAMYHQIRLDLTITFGFLIDLNDLTIKPWEMAAGEHSKAHSNQFVCMEFTCAASEWKK